MARQALHDLLCEIVGGPFEDGESHCYFEPPASLEIKYPCIVYNYANDLDTFADNIHYQTTKRYSVTVIDEDPDSEIPSRMKRIPYCTSDRNFAADGLSHFVFTLYFSGPRIRKENI